MRIRKSLNIFEFKNDCVIGYTTKGEKFTFSLEDYDEVSKRTWCISKQGYVVANINKKVVKMNRLLLNYPICVDHINGDKTDNRRENLRICTFEQNSHNQRKPKNIVGFQGIDMTANGKYRARISVKGKEVRLGNYSKLDDAINARLEAEKKYYGEYAIRR
jgi:hypothetical protein